MYIEFIIFVQSTEMEEKFSACNTKIMYLGNKRIFTIWTQRNVLPFCNLYYVYASNVKSAHTHITCFVNKIRGAKNIHPWKWSEKTHY